ncbi:hypothetical protein TSMEX_007863, partial [Taenia solium]
MAYGVDFSSATIVADANICPQAADLSSTLSYCTSYDGRRG